MKKLFSIILAFAVLSGLTGCGKQSKAVKESAQAAADAFSGGDMTEINEIIFGTKGLPLDDELSDVWEDTNKSENGILEAVFECVTVKVKKTTDTSITYEIEAPDMSNVFDDLPAGAEDMPQEELLQYIRDYAKNAGTTKSTVSLDYILIDGEPVVNYRDEAFINAVTGGLLEAYQTLYAEMIEAYMEGANLK